MSNPCHVELIVSQVDEQVTKAPDAKDKVVRLNTRQRAKLASRDRRAVTASA